MSYLNTNIRHLRKQNTLTQGTLADQIGIKRSLVGAYEELRAEPKIQTIQKLSELFAISIDDLINIDLSNAASINHIDVKGQNLRVLPIVIHEQKGEYISVVPAKAEAGYAEGYADPEFIEDLPRFSLPLDELYQDQSTRLFQITGDSMLPIRPESYIITNYVENWSNIKEGDRYILVTRDRGVVFKRIYFKDGSNVYTLKSDNTLYEPYDVTLDEILEVWHANGYISFDMPDNNDNDIRNEMHTISSMVSKLQSDMSIMKGKLMSEE